MNVKRVQKCLGRLTVESCLHFKERREKWGDGKRVEEDFKRGEKMMARKKYCGSCFKIPSTV